MISLYKNYLSVQEHNLSIQERQLSLSDPQTELLEATSRARCQLGDNTYHLAMGSLFSLNNTDRSRLLHPLGGQQQQKTAKKTRSDAGGDTQTEEERSRTRRFNFTHSFTRGALAHLSSTVSAFCWSVALWAAAGRAFGDHESLIPQLASE